jgi:SAM-dependent methyltransferase
MKLLLDEACPLQHSPDLSVLELGSGSGDFVKACNTVYPRTTITAVEKNTECSGNFNRLHCTYIPLSIEEYVNTCKDHYDVICLFDVLEHLRDPLHIMREITALLSPQGKIVLTTPVTDSRLKHIMGKFWPQYKLEHLFYFSNASFRKIGTMLGLNISKISPLSKTLPLSYLLSVGSNFGPSLFMNSVTYLSKIVPMRLYDRKLRLPLGETLVIYEKST